MGSWNICELLSYITMDSNVIQAIPLISGFICAQQPAQSDPSHQLSDWIQTSEKFFYIFVC